MTGRERLSAILRKQPVDRLAWTTLVDDATLSGLPPELRGHGGIDFYRHLGCDIFMLNGWGTPLEFATPEFHWPAHVQVVQRPDGDRVVTEWQTPKGTLVGIARKGHPVKFPVDSIESLAIYREMWEGASFAQSVRHDDAATLVELDGLIGDDGVVTRFWGPSTIPRLLEYDMGAENFYYLLADHRKRVEELIATMHHVELDAFDLLAAGPWQSVTLIENTSTYYISPQVYRLYNMPHQRDFVERVQSSGRTAILHMCGHVRDILPLIAQTGCDGIHTLTPPPTGNTPWELALDVLGEDLIIIGALDPSIFAGGPVADIPSALDALMTPRLRRANFVLCPMADGVAVGLERFQAVATWIEAQNASQ